MSGGELAGRSIADLGAAFRSGEVSPREVVADCLDRIARRDGDLNSFITVTGETALAEAAIAEREIHAGQDRGLLHGIPIGLKDLIATKGVRTTSGSKIDADRVPDFDATIVERLRAAGAISIGKTNLHEFAYGPTSASSHFGPVRNPWQLDRIAGGSSGGSAAAVQAGLVGAAIGTDTGGSIRIPASLCGIVGLKPTYGRVSRHGVTPLAWSLDHIGPMARTVEDAAILLNAIAGPDPRDPASANVPVPDATRDLRAGVRGLRIGVCRGFFFDRLEPGVRASVERAIATFRDLGAVVLDDVALPQTDLIPAAQLAIAQTEALAFHDRRLRERPDDYRPDVRARLETARFVPAATYSRALAARSLLIAEARRALRDVDLILTPTEPIVAPPIGATEITIGGAVENVRGALLRLTSPFNLLGLPALSVPCGLAEGLPVGLQIAGKPFAEGLVLRAGWAYEQARGPLTG